MSYSTDSSIPLDSNVMQEQMQKQLSDCDDTLQDGDSIEEQKGRIGGGPTSPVYQGALQS